ncbi:MAG TPA: PPOX class F420-dependent oxidoreductase [Nitriliruptorales bacterium]|nr:PPOX class F420-dependent oxidoreductase [Nitriliruptorales bacterium]
MDVETARDFVREHPRAVMATFRQDGGLQLSPVLVGIDADGRAIVSTRETAVKAHNLERDPRTSLCVLSEGFYGRWVRLDGTAEIVRLPQAMEPLVDYYRRVAGEHDDWDDYREAMRREERVLIRVTVQSVGPDVSG